MGFWCNGLGWAGWGGTGLIGTVLGLVFFVGLLSVLGLGVIWLVRQLRRGEAMSAATRSDTDPLTIAQRRLAAGEISLAELEEIRDRLQS